jgi:hypothetical protein
MKKKLDRIKFSKQKTGLYWLPFCLPQHRLLTAMSRGRIELEKNIIRREREKKRGAALEEVVRILHERKISSHAFAPFKPKSMN